jgi:glycosyltransferase involved in cell wall biosynthesis
VNILIVSPVLPYGPADGDRIRIYNIAKQLKEQGGHRLFLVSFIRKGEEKYLGELKKYYDAVETVKISKAQIYTNAFKAVFRLIPLNTGAYESSKMERTVRQAVKKYSIGHVFAYRLRCAQFVERLELPKSIDYVDSLALYMERSLKYESNPLYLAYYWMDRKRVLDCERRTASYFDNVFINSEDDRQYLGRPNIVTAPNGAGIGRVKKAKNGVFTIGFFGNIHYRPNLDAVTWFCKNVWKKLPNSDKSIKLVIAGSGSEAAAGLVKGTNSEVKGFIRAIDAEVASWDASIVPVRFGAGRQNKIMQSWANRTPVIATGFTARGVYGVDGVNLLTAETPEDFIRQIKRVKDGGALVKRLADNGAKTLKEHFDWKKTGAVVCGAVKKTGI